MDKSAKFRKQLLLGLNIKRDPQLQPQFVIADGIWGTRECVLLNLKVPADRGKIEEPHCIFFHPKEEPQVKTISDRWISIVFIAP